MDALSERYLAEAKREDRFEAHGVAFHCVDVFEVWLR
jgi:hypothetical protein